MCNAAATFFMYKPSLKWATRIDYHHSLYSVIDTMQVFHSILQIMILTGEKFSLKMLTLALNANCAIAIGHICKISNNFASK